MRKSGIIFSVCGIIGIASIFAVAQSRGGFGHGFMFDKIATELGLSNDQKPRQYVEKEKTKAALFAVLTTEQRTKANELRANFESKMKEKGGKDHEVFGKHRHRGEDFLPMF